MKTLKGAVLSNLSYTETQKLCSEYPTVFDCQWGLWRDKAVADFNVSPQFFDLVPQLSGAQRYLQIKSYYTLTPDMAVRVYSDGYIEGVYESVTGYEKAQSTGNKTMERFFTSRLKPEQIKYLKERGEVSSLSEPLPLTLIEELNLSKEQKSPKLQGLERAAHTGIKNRNKTWPYLLTVIESGRVDYLDQILSRYFTLPQGFTIEKDIPYTPFWAEEFPLYDLPLYVGNLQDEIMYVAIRGSDSRVVDFFRSIFRDTIKNNVHEFYKYNREGLETHKRPEEAFGIYKRFRQSDYNYVSPFMVEEALDLAEDYEGTIMNNLGNITTLQSLLPFLTNDDAQLLYYMANPYPLSKKILEEKFTIV